MSENSYVLATGDLDRERLTILSSLYNPGTLDFMLKEGLQPGMKVLEVGCGTGHMAVELAKIVGSSGEVLASDNSEAQLAITQETIDASQLQNIHTLLLDLRQDLPKYKGQFDFIYGRWVIEWNQEHSEQILKELFETLKPGGILVYESIDASDSGLSSYPGPETARLYDSVSQAVWKYNQMEVGFIKRAYFLLKNWGATYVNMGVNQAILKTLREKSVMRLGMLSAEPFLKKGIQSEEEFDTMVKAFQDLEISEGIVGFFRNFLVVGQR